jgi:phage terminase small subunit
MGRHFSTLTSKQQAFVSFYLRGIGVGEGSSTTLNATKAAEAAGYGSPEVTGSRMLRKNAKIRAAVDEAMSELEATTEQILAREWITASTGAGRFAPVFRKYTVAEMLEEAERLGIDACIRKIKVTRNTDKDGNTNETISLEFYDAHRARKLLGERMGLFRKDEGGLDLSKLPPFLLKLVTSDADEVRSAVADLRELKAARDS